MSDQQFGSVESIQSDDSVSPLVRRVCERFTSVLPSARPCDYPAVMVDPSSLTTVMLGLRDDRAFDFAVLFSHTVVDHIDRGEFELLYFLHSLQYPHRLLVIVTLQRDHPVVASVCSIWKTAEWQEREAYDLFGIQYTSHPDLRRIFLEDDWQGFPLRKDYVDDFMLSRSKAGDES